jgi:hypothetical protein
MAEERWHLQLAQRGISAGLGPSESSTARQYTVRTFVRALPPEALSRLPCLSQELGMSLSVSQIRLSATLRATDGDPIKNRRLRQHCPC